MAKKTTKKITYSEPDDYFPKSVMKEFEKGTKKADTKKKKKVKRK